MSARDEAAGGVELLPCPFCGDRLIIVNGGEANPRLAQHPQNPLDGVHCPISWLSIPAHRFEMWNARSPSPRDQASSAMLGALEKIARIREIDHFGGASMAEEIARAAIAKVALLSSDGDTA